MIFITVKALYKKECYIKGLTAQNIIREALYEDNREDDFNNALETLFLCSQNGYPVNNNFLVKLMYVATEKRPNKELFKSKCERLIDNFCIAGKESIFHLLDLKMLYFSVIDGTTNEEEIRKFFEKDVVIDADYFDEYYNTLDDICQYAMTTGNYFLFQTVLTKLNSLD